MLFVLVGWVLFRASGFAVAGSILSSLVGVSGFGGKIQHVALLIAAALTSVLVPSAHEMKDGLLKPIPALAVGAAILAAICVLEVGKGAPLTFIYFQF
jgi:hypothetical protein